MHQQLKILQQPVKFFNKKNSLWLAIMFCLMSCNNGVINNTTQRFLADGDFNSQGLEIGSWRYYDDSNNIIEEGFFEDGIRKGKWYYNLPRHDSLLWIEFNDKMTSIKTNIPDFLYLKESDSSFLSFKDKDSSRVFSLVIGKEYSNTFDNYYDDVYKDLQNRNVKLLDTATRYLYANSGDKFIYNYVVGIDSLGKQFILFNIAGEQKTGELIEVSVRCESIYEDRGRKIFFSVIPNLFINSKRFLDQKDHVFLFLQKRG